MARWNARNRLLLVAGTCTMPTYFAQRATIHYPINRGRLIVEEASVGIISRWQIRKRRKRGESRQGCQGWTIWPRASYVVRSDDLLLRPRRETIPTGTRNDGNSMLEFDPKNLETSKLNFLPPPPEFIYLFIGNKFIGYII